MPTSRDEDARPWLCPDRWHTDRCHTCHATVDPTAPAEAAAVVEAAKKWARHAPGRQQEAGTELFLAVDALLAREAGGPLRDAKGGPGA